MTLDRGHYNLVPMMPNIRRPLAVLSFLWLVSGIGFPTERPQTPSAPFTETKRSETLAPGIEHEEIFRAAGTSGAADDRWRPPKPRPKNSTRILSSSGIRGPQSARGATAGW
ncbi:MAG: hypothetical protein Q8O91_00250 [Candidatus Aminicenantes bacterium]|nr:hypothetical protein [Candidatus Aminicenantes bacterium]